MTLAKRVIPCLDVDAGRVVKGVNFVDLRDAGDPAELAARYDEDGADELVFLDITASSDARSILLDAVRRTADQVFIPLTVGGGIRGLADIDARRDGDGYAVYSHGGRRRTDREAAAWAREAVDRGAGELLLTSMDRDGTGAGYDLALVSDVVGAVPTPVIASGGAGEPEHLREALTDAGADAALAASIFHFAAHPIPETKRYLREHGVEVRL